MFNPRVIPCLLLAAGRLVKTVRFAKPAYVGDPLNIIDIFSALGADEILLLDILATREGRGPDLALLAGLAENTAVPLAYGGGIRTLDHVKSMLAVGTEKVVLGTVAGEEPDLIDGAAALTGSQAIVVSVDVKRGEDGRSGVWIRNGTKPLGRDPVEFAREAEQRGAGEILIHSIDRDGAMAGYDIALTRSVAEAVSVPVIACGGAAQRDDLRDVVQRGGAAAAAAGSIFVFQGRNRSVLVNYFTREQREGLLP